MKMATSYRSIMIPMYQYNKMLESYDEAVNEIRRLKQEIERLTGKKVVINE